MKSIRLELRIGISLSQIIHWDYRLDYWYTSH